MKYETPQAFRQALEDRLRRDYPHHRIPRVRKMIAFERFMVRLNDDWVLKGGYALQLRTEKARTTQDIDLLARPVIASRIFENLVQQLSQDADDYFAFIIERSDTKVDRGDSVRFRVTARVAGRVFENFHVDIGHRDVIVDPIDYLSPPQMLAFAGTSTAPIPCYPVAQHLAEKIHAISRPRVVENSRLKDLIDILLLAGLDKSIQAEGLRAAVVAVFKTRGDVIPAQLGQFPISWRSPFNQTIQELELPYENLDEATIAAEIFVNPVLAGNVVGVWRPAKWNWAVD